MKKVKMQGRSRVRIALAFLLLISVLIFQVGCGQGAPTLKEGLDIKENIGESVSETTRTQAEEVIASLAALYLRKTGRENLPTATLNEIETVSRGVCERVLEYPISDRQMQAITEALRTHGEGAVSDIADIKRGEGNGSLDGVKALYLELSELVGADLVGRVTYGVVRYSYEYRYEKKMRQYQTYEYPYLLDEANALLGDKAVLENSIGEGSFVSAVKLGFMMSELFLGGALGDGVLSAFSDEELLLFITNVDAESVDVDSAGWELILSLFIPENEPSADASYYTQIFYTAGACDDISALSASMVEFTRLIAYAQRTLTAEDIAYLRSEGVDATLPFIFERFGEDEWAAFERATDLALSGDYYSVARQCYGEDFESYASSVTVRTLTELRSSVGGDSFTEYLEGYLAGISPAFTYGWKNDNS